jgi:DNA-binding beta-propeller fold protein YncE
MAIVNPQTQKITGNISVRGGDSKLYQHSTEQMLQYDRFVYVNCWSFDNQILIIDSEQDRVVDSIRVLKQPNSMVLDKNHALWVLTDGGFVGSPYGYEIPGLLRITSGSEEVEIIHRFEEGERPSELKINGGGDTLYFINRHIYRYVVGSSAEPEPFLSSPSEKSVWGGFYGLEVDPVTSDIYVADAMDHMQRGMIYRFDALGEAVDTFSAGISPGAFCFSQPFDF